MSPTPAEVRAARQAAGHTQTQAAETVHAALRSWAAWEDAGPHGRAMPAPLWQLYLLVTDQHPDLAVTPRPRPARASPRR